MGILKSRRKQQAEPTVTVSFEGMDPLVVVNYRQEYEDVLEALETMAAKEGNGKRILATIVFLGFGLLGIPIFFQRSLLFGIFAVIVVAYVVASQLWGPSLNRKKTAKVAAEAASDCQLQLYANGIQVRDNDNAYNVPYRIMNMVESENQFILVMGSSRFVVFPKRFFGDSYHLARELFTANLGLGRRYLVFSKGKKA